MKIAIIGAKGIPATFGGVEFHVDELARRLVKRGHKVSVYVRSWYTERTLRQYERVNLIHIPTIKTKHLDAFLHSFAAAFLTIFQDYDIVHFHALGPSFFSWLPRLFYKKIVTTIHSLDWQAGKWGSFARNFLQFCEYPALYFPHHTIVVSRTLQEYFQKKYNRTLSYIPNGVPMPQVHPPEIIKGKYGLKGGDYILWIGRITPEKRVDWLVKAYNNAKPEEKLVIAGGSSATDDYVHMVKNLAGASHATGADGHNQIVFTGYVTGQEKYELLSNAKLFVMPSYLEGLPIALLEAMSYALPCLVSDISPHREVITDSQNGYFFSKDNFSNFVGQLKELLRKSNDLTAVGRNAQAKVARNYNWDMVVDKLLNVYQKVI